MDLMIEKKLILHLRVRLTNLYERPDNNKNQQLKIHQLLYINDLQVKYWVVIFITVATWFSTFFLTYA